MARGVTKDVFKLFVDFQKKIAEEKPTEQIMYAELQMMNFRVRPLQGDVSILNLKDRELLAVLWQLGKLDEFFQTQYTQLSLPQRKTFFHLFDNLHQKYQEQLNTLNLKSSQEMNITSTIEMEIYKEEPTLRKIH